MMKVRLAAGGMALGLLLGSFLTAPAPASAQGPDGRWPLQPSSGVGRVIAPFLEGWYENEDGTISYSFGYNNFNNDIVELPHGEDNFLDPARYDGMQPTLFYPGKHRGVFAVTVPASERNVDVWWTLTNPNGEVTKVPGRSTWSAYQLDWRPRPHGTLPPAVSFNDGSGDVGRGPPGVMSRNALSARVGSPVTLELNVEDISTNDPTDARFRDGTELRVNWSILQGPLGGRVEFARHESTAPWPEPEDGGRGRGGQARQPGPEVIPIQDRGTARVLATFSMPGQYILRAEVDNFRRPDSSSGDQCCWTNGYVQVNVTE